MKTAHKVLLIVMAVLLILGALSLAIGIILGGSLGNVFAAARNTITSFLDNFFGFIAFFD